MIIVRLKETWIICPLIKQGQSIYTILENHPEITQCEKTIYTYIEIGLFKDVQPYLLK